MTVRMAEGESEVAATYRLQLRLVWIALCLAPFDVGVHRAKHGGVLPPRSGMHRWFLHGSHPTVAWMEAEALH